jgi:DNA-binding PadR family transcriptional regulator
MGYVTSVTQDGKKIYTITDAGLAFLSEKQKETDEIKSQMKNWWGCWSEEFKDEMKDVMRSLGDLGKTIGQKARQAGAEKIPQVKQALADVAKEIDKIFKS